MRPPSTIQAVGDAGTQPLGWAPFIVTTVYQEYFDAQPYDGTSAYGDTQQVAKSPEQRQSLNGGVSYGAEDDIILVAPVLTIVRNDADDDDVICQQVQISGGFPVGGLKHQVLSVIDDANKTDFDWVRAFDDA